MNSNANSHRTRAELTSKRTARDPGWGYPHPEGVSTLTPSHHQYADNLILLSKAHREFQVKIP